MYTLEHAQFLPIDIEEAWAFFSSPANLQKITPPGMGFNILSRLPEEMYPGLIISYTVRPLLGIPLRWVTEISHVQKPDYFVDTQLSGPYRIWHHQHHFREVEGGVEMRDVVNYELPFSILGKLAHFLFVRKRVEEIFEYRRSVLERGLEDLKSRKS